MIMSMRRFMSVAAASCIVVTSGLVGASAARADGPGYGGNAGDLTVKWTETSEAISAAPPDVPGQGETGPDPNKIGLQDANQALTILGMGFRASTAVRIQVGDIANVERKSDQTGTLALDVPAAEVGPNAPGASVLATGLSPSGTTRTLVGSVPPKPSGVGPQNIIPWIAGVFAVGALAYAGQGARKRRAEARAAQPVPTPVES